MTNRADQVTSSNTEERGKQTVGELSQAQLVTWRQQHSIRLGNADSFMICQAVDEILAQRLRAQQPRGEESKTYPMLCRREDCGAYKNVVCYEIGADPQVVESGLNDKLIEMGWIPPTPTPEAPNEEESRPLMEYPPGFKEVFQKMADAQSADLQKILIDAGWTPPSPDNEAEIDYIADEIAVMSRRDSLKRALDFKQAIIIFLRSRLRSTKTDKFTEETP